MRLPSARVALRNESLLVRIREIKAEHPFWGYRRVWAHLHFIDGLEVNKKRVLRLMREHALTVKGNARLKAKRTPSRSKPRPGRPNEWWAITPGRGACRVIGRKRWKGRSRGSFPSRGLGIRACP